MLKSPARTFAASSAYFARAAGLSSAAIAVETEIQIRTATVAILTIFMIRPRIIKGRPSRQAVAASREGALARVPSAAVAVKDLRPLRGAQRTRVLDRH